jgi:hypothetical protein
MILDEYVDISRGRSRRLERLCTEEFHKRYSLSVRVKWSEACSMHGKNEKCIQNLVRKPEGKKPLEKSGHG